MAATANRGRRTAGVRATKDTPSASSRATRPTPADDRLARAAADVRQAPEGHRRAQVGGRGQPQAEGRNLGHEGGAGHRAGEHRDAADDGGHRVGGHQIGVADRVGQRRSLGGQHEAGRRQQQEHRHVREGLGVEGDDEQRQRHQHGAEQRHHHQHPAAVVAVDDHPGEGADDGVREQGHRQELGDLPRRRPLAGLEEDHLGERDLGQAVGELARHLAADEAPVVRPAGAAARRPASRVVWPRPSALPGGGAR